MTPPSGPMVACKRCAGWAAHPYASAPQFCPNCGRDRHTLTEDYQ